ncbi:MAG: zf-TFIIB domain-containing protein [Chloroflexi bacterium]|nr:zf-TFIIB domain-containing protein [Chloroflexota bacterium]
MHCPICKTTLNNHLLDQSLPAYQCGNCNGIWISAKDYWEWLNKRDETLPHTPSDMPLPLEESANARLCAECGRIMRRFKVWPDIPFYLERCSSCTSIWFDVGEWEAIKVRQLHDEIHLFFSKLWQEKLMDDERRKRFERMYHDRFGAADYAKVKALRAWIDAHSKGHALRAYLNDRDPYKI